MTQKLYTTAFLSLLFASFSCGSGQAWQPDNTPLMLSGEVVDEAGDPIPSATVTLVAAVEWTVRTYGELDPNRATMEVSVANDGSFELGFERNDPRFLASGDSLLVVRAEAFQPQVVDVPIARIRAGGLWRFELHKSSTVEIQLRTADGNPLVDVSVYPAAVNGHRIPWCVAAEFPPASTDANGRARLDRVSTDSIDGLFVNGERIGLQRLLVRRTGDGELIATATPTREVQAKIKSVDPMPGISEVKMFAISSATSAEGLLSLPMQCAWSIAPVSESGAFQIDALGCGEWRYRLSCPASFAYRPTAVEPLSISQSSEPFVWELEFEKQVKLIASMIEANSETPLANIHIRSFDGRLESTFTGADGKAEFYRARDHVSYYPMDGLREFFTSAAFYQSTKKLPVDGEIVLDPIELSRSPTWRGRVVDDMGNGVANAKVKYEFGRERFTQTEVTFSGPDGYFRLYGVAEGTALKLSAIHGSSMSDPASIVTPPEKDVTLRLIPRESRKPTGRVVDLQGQPVRNLAVAIKAGSVRIKESYGAEELRAKELYDPPRLVRTDEAGRFEFPATIDFENRFQIVVNEPGFFPFFSPFIDGTAIAASSSGSDRLDLGDFPVMRRPDARQVDVTVESTSGIPLEGAEWVIVGARTGTIRGDTDDEGRATVSVPSSDAIVAVFVEGYHLYFGSLSADSDSLHVVLRDEQTPLSPGETDSIRDVPREQFAEAARKVFSEMETPDPKASTYHRVDMYYKALASIDPEDFARLVQEHLQANPQLAQAALYRAEAAISRQPELVERLIASDAVPATSLYGLLIRAAASTDDPDLRDEWLGEALVSARAVSGTPRMYALARLAQIFLLSGHRELAKQLVDEAWSGAPNLQEVVDSGKREMLVGESRMIGPILAIRDLETSRSLIRMTARETEIPRLLTQSWLHHGEAEPDEFTRKFRELSGDIPFEFEAGAWLRTWSENSGLVEIDFPIPDEVAKAIKKPTTRLKFLLLHARLTDDKDLQRKLIALATETIRHSVSPQSSDHFLFHYTGAMLPELRKFDSIDRDALDPLIFESLRNLPESFETDRLQTVLGGAAQLLALRDRRLARELLEPAMKDRGWLFMGRLLSLDHSQAILSAARIDPQWAAELVDQLCASELRHDPADQIEIRAGIVSALISAMDE